MQLALGVTDNLNNIGDWSNAAYDAAFAAIAAAPDDEVRHAAIIECERIISEEVPFIPVSFTTRNQLVHASVQGWHGNLTQTIDWTKISLSD